MNLSAKFIRVYLISLLNRLIQPNFQLLLITSTATTEFGRLLPHFAEWPQAEYRDYSGNTLNC
jgi:hypothetical protein